MRAVIGTLRSVIGDDGVRGCWLPLQAPLRECPAWIEAMTMAIPRLFQALLASGL